MTGGTSFAPLIVRSKTRVRLRQTVNDHRKSALRRSQPRSSLSEQRLDSRAAGKALQHRGKRWIKRNLAEKIKAL
jgi:hypothetical protein